MNWRPIAAVIAIIFILALVGGAIYIYATRERYETRPSEEKRTADEEREECQVRREPKTFASLEGFHEGKAVCYHDLQESSPQIGRLYIFVTGFASGGSPIEVQGQDPVFTAKRGDEDYSDFWEIRYVTVPEEYEANSIRNESVIEEKGFPVRSGGKIVNQPHVLEGDEIKPQRETIIGWADGNRVFSWRFEKDVPREPSNQNQVLTSNVYVTVRQFPSDGKVDVVEDQAVIFDTIPTERTYSPLRRIIFYKVPSDFKAGSVRSVMDVKEKRFSLQESDMLVNLPACEKGELGGE